LEVKVLKYDSKKSFEVNYYQSSIKTVKTVCWLTFLILPTLLIK